MTGRVRMHVKCTYGALEGLVGLEVGGHVAGDVREQRGAEANHQVHTLLGAVGTQVGDDLLDDVEVGTLSTAQVHIPLVAPHIPVQDGRLHGGHAACPQ